MKTFGVLIFAAFNLVALNANAYCDASLVMVDGRQVLQQVCDTPVNDIPDNERVVTANEPSYQCKRTEERCTQQFDPSQEKYLNVCYAVCLSN